MAPGADFEVITVRDEMKPFLRTLCTISATMASLCFIGVGIILTILYETKNTVWKTVAYFGAMSVLSFAFASIFALVLLYPKLKKPKEEKKRMLGWTIGMFAVGWIFFFVLISTLILAFAV